MSEAQREGELEGFRAEVAAWLEENFPKSLKGKMLVMGMDESIDMDEGDPLVWRQRVGEKGWGCPTWPTEYGGGGLNAYEARALQDEFAKAGATNPVPMMTGLGFSMVGPTILEYGTEEQKQQHIPPICKGEIRWCLGYSEPNAGSDLASLTTKAELNGDEWVVNGQKIWTSAADHSDWCGALVRTDPQSPKRSGISFLLLDMHQSGIETRPIKLMAGASPFCETFFNDAKTPKDQLLGPLNDGWSVGKRLLQHERQSQTGGGPRAAGPKVESLEDLAKRYVGVDSEGRLADPDLRFRIAKHLMMAKSHALTLQRIAAEAGANPEVSAAASILKNSATAVQQIRAELTLELMGYQGLGWEGDDFNAEELSAVRGWLSGKAMSIYGGSFEVQNNIISKNILGLPETTQQG